MDMVKDNFTFITPQGKTDVFYSEEIILPKLETKNAIYVVDENTVKIAKTAKNFHLEFPLVIIESGEENKSFKSIEIILNKALEFGLDRSAVFIAIGGGLICDLTAFAASIYMRGVKCKFLPTTLLAMVDASIGGKTGINFDNYKNIVGSFYKADEIYICLKALDSLDEEQYLSGLAEAFKVALLYSPKLYSIFVNNKNALLNRDKILLLEVIRCSVIAKANVVNRDFNEKSERVFLNFGHTFAHALESVSNFSIAHGFAVAWGIGRALQLGQNLGLTERKYANSVFELISAYSWLSEASPLKSKKRYSKLNLEISEDEFINKIIDAMKKDKKNKNSKIKLVLQEDMERTILKEVDEEDIKRVLK